MLQRIFTFLRKKPEALNEPPDSGTPETGGATPDGETDLPVKKKKWPFFVAGAAVLAAALVLAALLLTASPLARVARGLRNSAADLENNTFFSLTENVLNGGSTELVCDLSQLTGQGFVPGNLKVKLYTDADNRAAVFSANYGIPLIRLLELTAYVDRENFAISSGALLGKDTYGIYLPTFLENGQASSLTPYLGEKFLLLLEWLHTGSQDFPYDTEVLAEAGLPALGASLIKNARISEENTDLTLGAQSVKVSAVTVELDSEQLLTVIDDVQSSLHNSRKLQRSLVDAGIHTEVFYTHLDAEISALRQKVSENGTTVAFTFFITRSGCRMVGLDCRIAGKEPLDMTLRIGPDLTRPQQLRMILNTGEKMISLLYTVQTDDKQTYAAQFTAANAAGETTSGVLSYDKKQSDFTLSVTGKKGNPTEFTGSLQTDRQSATVEIASVTTRGKNLTPGITLTCLASDKIPDMPEYKDLLQLNSATTENLFGGLKTVIEILRGIIAPADGE